MYQPVWRSWLDTKTSECGMIGNVFVEGGGEEREGWQVEVEDEVVDRMKLSSRSFPGERPKEKEIHLV